MNHNPRILVVLLAATGLLLACENASPTPVDSDSNVRHRIGKSDWTPIGTCQDACDGHTLDGNCWCDDLCATYGDCCSDKAAICDGGHCVTDGDCGDDQYCAEIWCITGENCPPSLCTAKATEGMACNQAVPCSEGLTCNAEGICEQETCHIGGCSGQLCTPQEGAISTCEYKPEYGCYKKAGASCEAQPGGGCGWTMTGEAQQCLDDLADNAGCATHDDCSDDQFCMQIWCFTAPCVNPCMPRGDVGADCAEDAACKAGLSCVGNTCAAPGGACADHCGGQSGEGCWCDSLCTAYGDCCPGKAGDCP